MITWLKKQLFGPSLQQQLDDQVNWLTETCRKQQKKLVRNNGYCSAMIKKYRSHNLTHLRFDLRSYRVIAELWKVRKELKDCVFPFVTDGEVVARSPLLSKEHLDALTIELAQLGYWLELE